MISTTVLYDWCIITVTHSDFYLQKFATYLLCAYFREDDLLDIAPFLGETSRLGETSMLTLS